ncbi:uncharacterized protein LOC128228529 isoform X2 [Mya arenaria]|uniref:uncharacterized protein LOC128228529 isoform X2 n=1 Tax=Mya arenaria TaxID=6604 RepID=UPI0022E15A22|nr:uncharacterized protein LOC128228529 isoform X2 [Mya arenaria]
MLWKVRFIIKMWSHLQVLICLIRIKVSLSNVGTYLSISNPVECGQDATLICTTGSRASFWSFYRNETPIVSDLSKTPKYTAEVQPFQQIALTIHNAGPEDVGRYRCTPEYESVSNEYPLELYCMCISKGVPMDMCMTTMCRDSKVYSKYFECTYTTTKIFGKGNYTYVLQNLNYKQALPITGTFELHHSKNVTLTADQQTIGSGQTTELVCRYNGSAPIQFIIWQRNSNTVVVQHQSCINIYNKSNALMDISCPNSNEQVLKLRHVDQDVSAIVWQCEAELESGEELYSNSIVLHVKGPPGKPYDVQIRSINETTVTIFWCLSNENDRNVTTVTQLRSDTDWINKSETRWIKDTRRNSEIIQNLRPATFYFLRLFSYNGYGRSNSTETFTFITQDTQTLIAPLQRQDVIIGSALGSFTGGVLLVLITMGLCRARTNDKCKCMPSSRGEDDTRQIRQNRSTEEDASYINTSLEGNVMELQKRYEQLKLFSICYQLLELSQN